MCDAPLGGKRLWSSRQRCRLEGDADRPQDRDATSSGGLEHGSDVGVKISAPEGSEAVGDLAEDDAGPQGLFGPVVGGRYLAVGEEDEQALAKALDDALPLCCMGRRCGRIDPYPSSGSCDADVVRASEVQHSVQHLGGDGHLGRLPPVGLEA